MEVIKLNNDNFKSEVLESDKVVLVDFYADWCGPCKMMSPIIDKVAEEMGDKIKVCKLNVDEAQDWAIEYGVMSIPTLIIFNGGAVAETVVGLRDKHEVIDIINSVL